MHLFAGEAFDSGYLTTQSLSTFSRLCSYRVVHVTQSPHSLTLLAGVVVVPRLITISVACLPLLAWLVGCCCRRFFDWSPPQDHELPQTQLARIGTKATFFSSTTQSKSSSAKKKVVDFVRSSTRIENYEDRYRKNSSPCWLNVLKCLSKEKSVFGFPSIKTST